MATAKKQMYFYSNYEFTLWGDTEPRPVYNMAHAGDLLSALKDLHEAGQSVFSIKNNDESATVVVK